MSKDDWVTANQRYLAAALELLHQGLLEALQVTGEMVGQGQTTDHLRQALRQARQALPAPSALERVSEAFGLTPFESSLLLLCAAIELDARFPALCAAANGDPSRTYPTFSLALAALPEAHWSAITPVGALRRWRLVDVGPGYALTLSPLRIDERVLHYLAGVAYLDPRLASLFEPGERSEKLAPTHSRLVEQILLAWSHPPGKFSLPILQLCGEDGAAKRAIAEAACARLNLQLAVIPVDVLPAGSEELDSLARLVEREAGLHGLAIFLDCDPLDQPEPGNNLPASRLLGRVSSPCMIASRERWRFTSFPTLALDVARPGMREQRLLWNDALGARGARLNGQVDRLVSQFHLSAATIYATSAEAFGSVLTGEAGDLGQALWQASRAHARPRLDALAQRIEPSVTWDDLVLPQLQKQTLRDIAIHARNRATVYEDWGFGAKGGRGMGISALFSGSSGTGKTLAAEVLAHELNLDLYKIDLSQVVSKYIGETEKNLRQVFDAAEEDGAVLLFDEADALFGKRSEVKDSHDRYANIEISYLLQRMEAYRGLAILTTNMKSALDTAFMRRLRFVIHFPFPDAGQRAEIWQRIFPTDTPTQDLDVQRLARLNVAGGNIRNIAIQAAFLAADAGLPVSMAHVLKAARSEYAKLEKSLTEAEIEGWR